MALPSYQHINHYINGAYCDPVNNNFNTNINPATNKSIGKVAMGDIADVNLAVDAALLAFETWQHTTPEYRFTILNKIADLIDEHLNELALAECTDNGKPLWLTRMVDIPRARDNFRFFATACMHFASESHPMQNQAINYTVRQPIGVVACISPWNLPLYLFTWKIAPALAAGNCVIAKPSEVTPATAFLLGEICTKAGLPAGVLNIVQGDGANCGSAMVNHPKIKAISFTGSTKAGADIASIAAPKFKKLSLELGGKNPSLIFADCNWQKMMKVVVNSSFSNQGQICLCSSRLIIEDSIYEKFKTEFIANVKKITVGNPLDANNKMGAIVSEVHYNKILNCINIANQEGGKILCGGEAIKLDGEFENGFFIAPTVIEGLGPDTQTNLEEIFGPVVTLQKFSDGAEALELANASNYGLAATVWTQDINKANTIAQKVNCGIVWINCWLLRDLRTPFGGMKIVVWVEKVVGKPCAFLPKLKMYVLSMVGKNYSFYLSYTRF
jgi:aminomuconate-semialdehyde/2-hydroxymuconate-6-semialdehyde dehydrogenase